MPLPLPNDGLKAVNVYVIETADGLVLVDAGWAIDAARSQFQRGLAALGADFADIVRFLITHVHHDHYGQAMTIRSEFGTRVELGLGERANLEALRAPDRRPLRSQVGRLVALGADDLVRRITAVFEGQSPPTDPWELPDAWLTEGDIRLPGGRSLFAVETPGHTVGHMVFHDLDAGLLFAGDHVLPTITPSIGFEPAPTPAPLADFLASLAKVRARPDAMLLPAHGPVATSVHSRCDELVAHHDQRLEEMRLAVVGGASRVIDVARAVPWTRRRRSLDDLDLFNQMLAVSETAAHLDLLAARDELRKDSSQAVWRYHEPVRPPKAVSPEPL